MKRIGGENYIDDSRYKQTEVWDAITSFSIFFIMMSNNQQIQMMWSEITVLKFQEDDYVSLTDIAWYKNPI